MRYLAPLALIALLLSPLPAAAQEEKDVSVPISTLVLFTSGVGYFQHDGTVDGNAQMELTFSSSQINDLLKSLVVRDLDGGTITSVSYSSRDPITRTLKSFSVDLTSDPTLSMRARNSADRTIFTISLLSRAMTLGGVLPGARMPFQITA